MRPRRFDLRPALLGAALVALTHTGATAGVPSPPQCVVPTLPALCPLGDSPFTILVRDAFSTPVAGAAVMIDLCGCPDIHLCPTGPNDPYQVVDGCRVIVFSDVVGNATFPIHGGGNSRRVEVIPGRAASLFAKRLHVTDDGPGVGRRNVQFHGRHLGIRTAVPNLVEQYAIRVPRRAASVGEITCRMLRIRIGTMAPAIGAMAPLTFRFVQTLASCQRGSRDRLRVTFCGGPRRNLPAVRAGRRLCCGLGEAEDE